MQKTGHLCKIFCINALFLVEATGLEPTTSWSLTKRATKLRYASMRSLIQTTLTIIALFTYYVKRFSLFFCIIFNFFQALFYRYIDKIITCFMQSLDFYRYFVYNNRVGEKIMKKVLEKEEDKGISKATIARMPLYLRFFQDESSKGNKYVSSTVIAQSIAVSSVLVRKDLALVSSESGRPRLGFSVGRMIVDIEKFLGYDAISDVIVVGAGGLGRAFLGYEGFGGNGLNVLAAFDINPNLIGTSVAGKPVLDMQGLESFVKEHNIQMGIVTVPKESAQEVVDVMVQAGIKAIWNFAPSPLRVPKDVVLKTEDLASSLAMLAGKLYRANGQS